MEKTPQLRGTTTFHPEEMAPKTQQLKKTKRHRNIQQVKEHDKKKKKSKTKNHQTKQRGVNSDSTWKSIENNNSKDDSIS